MVGGGGVWFAKACASVNLHYERRMLLGLNVSSRGGCAAGRRVTVIADSSPSCTDAQVRGSPCQAPHIPSTRLDLPKGHFPLWWDVVSRGLELLLPASCLVLPGQHHLPTASLFISLPSEEFCLP